MRVRIVLKLRKAAVAPGMFGAYAPAARAPWLPIAGSVLAHGVVLLLLPVLASEWADYYSDDVDWSKYTAQTVRIRIPEPLYYARPEESRDAAPASGSESPRTGGRARRSAAELKSPLESASVQLPKLPSASRRTPVLTLDHRPLDEATPKEIPAVAFWAREAPPITRPERTTVPVAGRTEAPGPVPRLAAVPVLARPNTEPEAGQTNLPAKAAPPALPAAVQSSSVAPVRDQADDPKPGAFEMAPGQSANFIAVSPKQARPGQIVPVPVGSTGSAATNPPGAGASSDGGTMAARGRAVSDRTRGRSDETRVAIEAPPSSGSPGHTRPDAVEGPKSGQPARMQGSDAFLRIMHPPGGNFDVVVTQSGRREELQASDMRLSGASVYTVFLSVGDERDWEFAYCLPAPPRSRDSRYEIFVDDPAPLSPPRVVSTSIPRAMVGRRRPDPVVFRGLLTSRGVLRDMKATHPSEIGSLLEAAFEQWQFGPARQNNVAVDIEVMLIVPATKERQAAAHTGRRTAVRSGE